MVSSSGHVPYLTDNSKDWFREDKYIEENYGKDFVI